MSAHEHTKTDGLGEAGVAAPPAWRAPLRNERMAANKIECNACPVLCQITEGRVGACDRYANHGGTLVRLDPVLVMRRAAAAGSPELVPFAAADPAAAGERDPGAAEVFVTGVG